MGAPSAPSWTDLPPASLLGKDGVTLTTSPRGSPRKTPVTSPTKSSGLSSPANSPSKVSQRTGDKGYRRFSRWLWLGEVMGCCGKPLYLPEEGVGIDEMSWGYWGR